MKQSEYTLSWKSVLKALVTRPTLIKNEQEESSSMISVLKKKIYAEL